MEDSRFGAVRRFLDRLVIERDAILAALRENKNSPDHQSEIHDCEGCLDEAVFFPGGATAATIEDFVRGPGSKEFEAIQEAACAEALSIPTLADSVLRAVDARDGLLSDASEAYQDNKGSDALRTYHEHCDAINRLHQVLAAAESLAPLTMPNRTASVAEVEQDGAADSCSWRFEPGLATYCGTPVRLTAMPQDILEVLAKARFPVTAAKIRDAVPRLNEAATSDEAIRAHLSVIRDAIRDGFEMPSVDPIPLVRRGNGSAWKLDMSVISAHQAD